MIPHIIVATGNTVWNMYNMFNAHRDYIMPRMMFAKALCDTITTISCNLVFLWKNVNVDSFAVMTFQIMDLATHWKLQTSCLEKVRNPSSMNS